MKRKVLGVVSAVLFVVATLVSSTASYWFFYQPRVPKALQKWFTLLKWDIFNERASRCKSWRL